MVVRPAGATDEPFLFALHGSTRDDLRALGLPEAHLAALLDLQARAQHADYTRNYASEGHFVVELDGEPIGRIWVDRRPDELLVVDVALLPAHRSRGIGALLFRELFDEADEAGLRVRMTTQPANDGMLRFARRHGFTVGGGDATSVTLVREPRVSRPRERRP